MNNFGFEEMHITKRTDGEGFTLIAKGIVDDEPCTIEVPMLQQPNINVDDKRDGKYMFGSFNNIYRSVSLSFQAIIKPEKEMYYKVTIDPEFYTKKQIRNLEIEIEEIKNETDKKVKELTLRVNELKKHCDEVKI